MGILLEFHGIPVESCVNAEEFLLESSWNLIEFLLESCGIPVESCGNPEEFMWKCCGIHVEIL